MAELDGQQLERSDRGARDPASELPDCSFEILFDSYGHGGSPS
jgi:hypothetical protein